MRNKSILSIPLILYIIVIIYLTIIFRERSFEYQIKLLPFWSYRVALDGDLNVAKQIFENIILFFSLGFILSRINKKSNYLVTIILGLSISIFIEMIQLICKLGLFEFDDIINNTVGCIIGAFFYTTTEKNNLYILREGITWGCTVVAVIVCMLIQPNNANLEQKFFSVKRY